MIAKKLEERIRELDTQPVEVNETFNRKNQDMGVNTSITDIARWLEQKKDTSQRVILFTGARTGGLFRSKPLYSTVRYFSPHTFDNMSRVAQFGECYRTLEQEDFSKAILIPF
jgi:hypothetical protein